MAVKYLEVITKLFLYIKLEHQYQPKAKPRTCQPRA